MVAIGAQSIEKVVSWAKVSAALTCVQDDSD